MSEGAPDYGPQDLVVCVDDYCDSNTLRLGEVYLVERLQYCPKRSWGVWLVGRISPFTGAYRATRFRRLDPLPPEFFAGRVEADVPQPVTA